MRSGSVLKRGILVLALLSAACGSGDGGPAGADVAGLDAPEAWVPDGGEAGDVQVAPPDLETPDVLLVDGSGDALPDGGGGADLPGDVEPEDGVEPEVLPDAAADTVDVAAEDVAEDLVGELPSVCVEGDWCDDGDPCTVDDVCDGEGGCSGEPMLCDDGDPRTEGDACLEGTCVPGEDQCECHLDVDCLGLDDGDPCTGVMVCNQAALPWVCEVAPGSVPDCDSLPAEPCTAWACVGAEGGCVAQPSDEGLACDDGDPCTVGDVCVLGSCQGEALPTECEAGSTYCLNGQVCLCGDCGIGCVEVVDDCQGMGFLCEAGVCVCDCPPAVEPVCDVGTETTYENLCQAECEGVGEPMPGACGDCLGSCSEAELATGEVCGKDGQTYPSFCALKCALGQSGCTLAICHEMAYQGGCLDVCVTEPDAEPAVEGGSVPGFLCKDLNTGSESYQGAVSDVTLKELIWVAYFGACT
jgi:hypothetical protein